MLPAAKEGLKRIRTGKSAKTACAKSHPLKTFNGGWSRGSKLMAHAQTSWKWKNK